MSCGCTQKIVNAAGATFRVAKQAVASKEIFVAPEIKAARLATCAGCDEIRTSADGTAHKCADCGCWLDGKILCKACLLTEDCPQNKWTKL